MKLTSRILTIIVLFIALIALSSPSSPVAPVVEAGGGGSDCQVASQVCHDINAGLYLLCVNQTGDYTGCAETEANNNISCMNAAGCPYNH